MALAYTPPGVTVDEIFSPVPRGGLAVGTTVCLVGRANGFVQGSDYMALTNEDAIAIPNFPRGVADLTEVVSVTNINNLETYTETTDYTVNLSSDVDEIQTVTLAGATGGTFTLSFQERTTGNIAYNASAATVLTALETGTNEVQSVTVSATAGQFTLTYEGQETADIAYNATAGTVQTALLALSNLDTGDVVVSGGPGDATGSTPYVLTFGGDLASTNVAQVTGDDGTTPLSGGTGITTATTTSGNPGAVSTGDVTVTGSAGGPYEITFGGDYANTDVETLTADAGLLTGTTPTVTIHTVTDGGVIGTITRVDSGNIAEGETVLVVYRYVPDTYYTATRLDSLSAVESRYGEAVDSDGVINSEVSYAAQLAFENGSGSLVIQPLFQLETPGDPDSGKLPVLAGDMADVDTHLADTLYALRDITDINIIVPVIGQSSVGVDDAKWLSAVQTVQDHIRFMEQDEEHIIMVVGEDSSTSTSVAQMGTLRDHAFTLKSRLGGLYAQNVVFLSPSKFGRGNAATGQRQYLGGQYAAAALAGALASRPVSASMTREVLSGLNEVADYRSRSNKNEDAANGLTVLEQQRNVVVVRHGITLDDRSSGTREIPVVRAKHRMIESIRNSIDTTIIGRIVADGDAPLLVTNTVANILDQLVESRDIVSYKDVQSRTLNLDPTTVEVRFSYRPAFPLNYVRVAFSLDLTTGTINT